jgi:hypothetical protein
MLNFIMQSVLTLSKVIVSLSITSHSIKFLYAECKIFYCYAGCRIVISILIVIMPNAVILSFMAPSNNNCNT